MRVTKLLAAVIGVPIIIGSLAITVGGGIALAIPNDDGWVTEGPVRMQTDAVAFVGDDIDVHLGHRFDDGHTFVGIDDIPIRLDVDSRNGKEVFVGVASQLDASAYLAGVAIAEVRSFEDDPDVRSQPGALTAARPADQDFWVATSSGGELRWDLEDGTWAIVVLNEDGSPGVDVAVTGSARIPFLGPIGVVLLVVGLMGITVGVVLTYFGVRRVPRPAEAPQAPVS